MTATETIKSLLRNVATAYADDSVSQETYATAIGAVMQAITERLGSLTQEITVTAGNLEVDSPSEQGGGLYADYKVTVTVGNQSDTFGGWKVCGWIAPGASQGLDGSGLANWGSSQPGCWAVEDSDGAFNGALRVCVEDGRIKVDSGDNMNGELEITVAGLLGLDDADQALIDEYLDCRSALTPLADRIEDAINALDIDIPCPSAEEIWHDLGSDQEAVKDTVRVGKYCGVYTIIVVYSGNGYTWYQPGESWEEAVRKAAVAEIEAEIEALNED